MSLFLASRAGNSYAAFLFPPEVGSPPRFPSADEVVSGGDEFPQVPSFPLNWPGKDVGLTSKRRTYYIDLGRSGGRWWEGLWE